MATKAYIILVNLYTYPVKHRKVRDVERSFKKSVVKIKENITQKKVVPPPQSAPNTLLKNQRVSKMTKVQEVERQNQLALAHHDHHKSLNAYAFFKLSDSALGQDLVQDTFVKTWSYLVKRGEITGMKSFLYHVLNNLIVDEYRKRKRSTVSLDVLLENGFSPDQDTGDSEAKRNQNIFDGKGVLLLIQKLPETYQQVVRMRYEQDLSLKEIGVLLGESENTISVRVHRGVQKLKLLYGLTHSK